MEEKTYSDLEIRKNTIKTVHPTPCHCPVQCLLILVQAFGIYCCLQTQSSSEKNWGKNWGKQKQQKKLSNSTTGRRTDKGWRESNTASATDN
jgi:hypothetical protein